MWRRWFALLILAAAPLRAEPPNVVLLVSDDQRSDAIHALGNRDVETPHLDRLIGRGFHFNNAYCMGSTVGAVCQPSRAMLLSGRSLYRAPKDLGGAVTLPERFRQAGYDTFGTGKWHNGPESFARSFTQGGAVFLGGMGGPYELPVRDFNPTARQPLGAKHLSGKHATTLFADDAVRFLKQPREKPFFLYVSFTSPHDPRTAPPEFAAKYDPTTIALPPNFLPEHPFDNGELTIRDEQLEATPRTPEAIRRHLADYYAMVSHVDHEVGRILAALEASGEAEETYVVFTSDHGLAIGSHGLMGKQNLYEHSMKAPLIVAGRKIPHGYSDAFVYLFDLYPTLCDLADIEPPSGTEGTSLVAAIKGERTIHDEVFTAYRDVQRSIRDGCAKLIVYPQAARIQLFDLDSDPHETNDLSKEPSRRATIDALSAKLVAAQKRYGDALELPMMRTESE